jgi:hypothetical protein
MGSGVLTSALEGGHWSVSILGCYTLRERARGIHWIGGWVLWSREKSLALPGIEPRPSNSYHFVILVDLSRLLAICLCREKLLPTLYRERERERESHSNASETFLGSFCPFGKLSLVAPNLAMI